MSDAAVEVKTTTVEVAETTTTTTTTTTTATEVHVEEEIEIPDHIERLPKPDKAAFDADIAKLDAEIKKLQARTTAVRGEMDALKTGRGGYGEQIQAAKAVYSTLRSEKDSLIQQRNQITARLRSSQDKKEATIKTQRSSRSALRFQTEEEFDDEIEKLRHQQETRSMSLTEEKKLVKEIEALQVQRHQVAKVAEDRSVVDKQVDGIKEIRAEQAKKNQEIDAVQAKLVEQKGKLDELYRLNDEEKKQDQFPVLAKERREIKEQLDALFGQLKARRAEFKAANDRYYENIRLVRKKKELERKKEDERRRQEYEAKLAEYEKEMAKIHPYQDEMDMCDAIVAYMEKNFAKELKEHADSKAEENAGPAELDGLKPLKREEEDFIMLGGKNKKKGKKEGGKKKRATKVSLTISQLESYATIGLLPPASFDAVVESVKAVKEKKAWFKEQTSRPKSETKRAAKEPAAKEPAAEAKPKTEAAPAKAASPKKKSSNKKFDAADKSAFPTLGSSETPVVGAAPSSWGPGMTVFSAPAPISAPIVTETDETTEEES